MRLYFVRHGESEANLLHEFSNRGTKHGLTPRGRQQAAQLAQRLQTAQIQQIYCSPLLRARQTARIIAAALELSYEPVSALTEYDCGILEGCSDAASWQLYNEVLNAWLFQRRWERKIEGGESYLELQARFVPFIEGLVRQYSTRAERLLLVGHGGLYRCMLPLILSNIDIHFVMQHHIPNTGVIVAEPRPQQLVCLDWCGLSVPL